MSYHPLDAEKPEDVISNDDLMAIVGGKMTHAEYRSRPIREAAERRRREILADIPAHLQTFTTRALLALHRQGYKGGDVWLDGVGEVSYHHIEQDVRNVLATRPHIPNKKEGKALRRKAATAHHGKRR